MTDRMRTKCSERRLGLPMAFTLVEVMIVIAILGLLAGIAIPNYLQSRTQAQTNACISNLRQIDAAIQDWALEARSGEGAPVTYSDINSYLKGTVLCPAGGKTFEDSYSITTVSEPPACRKAPALHRLVP